MNMVINLEATKILVATTVSRIILEPPKIESARTDYHKILKVVGSKMKTQRRLQRNLNS